ncbi:MAG: hypothetical protein A4E63_03022 [Syntrophorhabdus sp. PtaU1.Bin050]|nr:MAG: hypothetical protein A4E63_03022 [Syntrophorhabdus sp. PtaU1.Bin050]
MFFGSGERAAIFARSLSNPFFPHNSLCVNLAQLDTGLIKRVHVVEAVQVRNNHLKEEKEGTKAVAAYLFKIDCNIRRLYLCKRQGCTCKFCLEKIT